MSFSALISWKVGSLRGVFRLSIFARTERWIVDLAEQRLICRLAFLRHRDRSSLDCSQAWITFRQSH